MEEAKKNSDQKEGHDQAEDDFQLKAHTAMARSRDTLYFERGIDEQDLDYTIKELKLEDNETFATMCRQHDQEMEKIYAKYSM